MIKLVKLSPNNKDRSIFDMLQRIKANENEFKNTAYGLTYDEFLNWLVIQNNWSEGINLPDGYSQQTVYWLYLDSTPIGIGKIRHTLNEHSRIKGGNIGCAIDPFYRGKGYGTIILKLLAEKTKEMGIEETLITVEKYNPASKKAVLESGGKLIKENDFRWFFTYD